MPNTRNYLIMQQTSISVSDYRSACRKFIEMILKRPGMYYKSLEELEIMLGGHQAAFEQLGVITREQSFGACFIEWIRQTKGISCQSGWAYGIETLQSAEGDELEMLFVRLVTVFLKQWDDKKGMSKNRRK